MSINRLALCPSNYCLFTVYSTRTRTVWLYLVMSFWGGSTVKYLIFARPRFYEGYETGMTTLSIYIYPKFKVSIGEPPLGLILELDACESRSHFPYSRGKDKICLVVSLKFHESAVPLIGVPFPLELWVGNKFWLSFEVPCLLSRLPIISCLWHKYFEKTPHLTTFLRYYLLTS